MLLARLVHFLQTAIVTFNIEHILLVGDAETLPKLFEIRQRVNATLPAIVVCISSASTGTELGPPSNVCANCPTNRMTIVQLGSLAHFMLARSILDATHSDRNRIVLVPAKVEYRTELLSLFAYYNLVLVVVDRRGFLVVYACGRYVDAWHRDSISAFDGEELFHSHDINALLFRRQLQRWPSGRRTVGAIIVTVMMAPYSFLVTDDDDDIGKVWLASSSLTLLQIIGDVLRFKVNVYFYSRSNGSAWFEALPMRSNVGSVTLFDYDKIVRHEPFNPSGNLGLMVTQNKRIAGLDKGVFETRRYLAIVPHQTDVNQAGSWTLANTMLNAAVLLVWLAGAVLFALLRIRMRTISRNTKGNSVHIFFNCLAGVLGNSGGTDRCGSHGELLVKFWIGVFAVLTSTLFTGTLFEQLVSVEPAKQIDTMAELAASKLPIVECWGENMFSDSSGPNPSIEQTTNFASVGQIEWDLLSHDTRSAFVLPEAIADIVDHPALRYANGTPVYHIVAEPYRKLVINVTNSRVHQISSFWNYIGIALKFITVVPVMMQGRLMSLWTRLAESGINRHVERKTANLYKAVRSEWYYSKLEVVKASRDEDSEGSSRNETVLLMLFVLCIGHSTALVVFFLELTLVANWRNGVAAVWRWHSWCARK